MYTPDYKNYTLQELQDALKNIDKEEYPERVEFIVREIELRQSSQGTQLSEQPAEEFKEDIHPNWFVRYWKGQVSLPISYWVVGIGVNILIVFLSLLTERAIESAQTHIHLSLYILALYLTTFIIITWQSVGLYRTASLHPYRGGSLGWAIVAKIMLFVGLFSFFTQMYSTAFPLIKGAVEDILGTSERRVTAFRILNNGKELEVYGGLELGAEVELRKQLENNPSIKLVHLHSKGGRILAAQRMGKVVREYGLDTYVKTSCSSACTLVYLFGKNRLLADGAKLNFHAPSAGGYSAHDNEILRAKMEQSYRDVGVPEWFIKRIMETHSDTFWTPNHDELFKADIIHRLVNKDNYASSGFGDESAIKAEDYAEGLLNYKYMVAMKEHDPQTFDRVVELGISALIAGKPQRAITQEFSRVVFDERLPVYIAHAGDKALVEYWKTILFQMRELRDEFPLACAAMTYPEEVPVEHHLDNSGELSQEAKLMESTAIAGLIESYSDSQLTLTEEDQQALVVELVKNIKDKDEAIFNVVASPSDYITEPTLMCDAAIMVSEGFISFDTETSGKLLRSVYSG